MARAGARPAGEIASGPAAWFLLPGRLQVLLVLRRGRGSRSRLRFDGVRVELRERAGGSVCASRRGGERFLLLGSPAEENPGGGCGARARGGTRGGVRLEVGER